MFFLTICSIYYRIFHFLLSTGADANRRAPHLTSRSRVPAFPWQHSASCARRHRTYGEEDGGECYERRRDWCVNVAVSERFSSFRLTSRTQRTSIRPLSPRNLLSSVTSHARIGTPACCSASMLACRCMDVNNSDLNKRSGVSSGATVNQVDLLSGHCCGDM